MVRAFLNSQSCRKKLTNPQARVIITPNIIERKNQSIGFLLRLIIRGINKVTHYGVIEVPVPPVTYIYADKVGVKN